MTRGLEHLMHDMHQLMHAREHKTRYNKEKIIRYQEDEKTMIT